MKRLREGLIEWTRSFVGVAIIAAVGTAGIAVYVISPRFHVLRWPSLIDDWTSMYWGPNVLHQLEHFSYNSVRFDATRYRPAFWLWSDLQWHTFGAPLTLRGPNAWNLLRICALALALALLVVAGMQPDRRRKQSRVRLGLLAAVPGFLLFTTPAFGVDLARFGPQEPLLIAGLGLGGLALLLAARLVLERRASLVVAIALAVAGFLVWAFGVYMKEASVCMFVLAPFLLLDLRSRWQVGRVTTRWTTVAAAGIGLLALVPLIQLTVEVVRLSHQPTIIYGSAPPHGLSQWIMRVKNAVEQQWNGIPSAFGQPLWQGLGMALPPLAVAVWARTRRPPWLALGMLALGWSLLVFEGLPGVVVSRYYMPVFAAFAIALVLLIAELPRTFQLAVIAASAVLGLNGIPNGRRAVQAWVAGEGSGQELVSATGKLNPRRCPVYYANFDIERHFSLPIVLALQRDSATPCISGQAALVIEGGPSLPTTASQPIVAACSPPGWQQRLSAGIGTIYSCAHLRRGTALVAAGARQSVADVLAQNRLVIPRSASAN